MARLTRTAAQSVGAVFTAASDTITNTALLLHRTTEVGYSHIDTYGVTSAVRNKGRIEDALLEEEENDHNRALRRMKLAEQKARAKAKHDKAYVQIMEQYAESTSKTLENIQNKED